MSLVEETLNKAVRDIINNILEINNYAIKAKQNAPRPTDPYSSVDVMSIRRMGLEEQELKDQPDPELDIEYTAKGHREVTFSLQFYFANAMDNALKVHIGLVRFSIGDILRAANLGLVTRSEVRDISEPLENGWEERAQLDMVLSALGTDEEIVRSIQSVSISGEYQERGISTPITIEV